MLVFWLTCFLAQLLPAYTYFINIEPKNEICFYDTAVSGTKMSLTFEVAEGGFLDIDVRISGPEGKTVYKGSRESSGKYAFSAYMDGDYKYCFGNAMSKMTSKVVKFNMDIGETPKHESGDTLDQDHDKLAEQLEQLSGQLVAVKHDQEYMEVRDRTHSMINGSTNQRVVWWAFFEALVLLAMSLGQVYYLKRFFEVRRVV